MVASIDLKDRQILYFLDRNSRQSFSKIAKKINIAKASVLYRVNKMIETGIIKNFYTVINPFKLGFIPFRFYLRFQYADPAIEKQIIDHFAHDPRAWWVASLNGKYSLAVNMLIKNNHEFLDFWRTTLDKYRYYIQEEVFSIYFQLCARNYSYLYSSEVTQDIQKYIINNEEKKTTLTENEVALLRLLSNSARTPGVEIANHLNISPAGVNYLFKQLEKKEIILGYRVNLDIKKLGFEDFKLDIFLTDYQKRDEVISYLELNPHLVLLSRSVGISDVEAEFHFEDIQMLHAIINQLLERFPGIIRSYSYHHVVAQHKWNFVPLI
jgi:DNA-binding Lrp family transcriptional regulator